MVRSCWRGGSAGPRIVVAAFASEVGLAGNGRGARFPRRGRAALAPGPAGPAQRVAALGTTRRGLLGHDRNRGRALPLPEPSRGSALLRPGQRATVVVGARHETETSRQRQRL